MGVVVVRPCDDTLRIVRVGEASRVVRPPAGVRVVNLARGRVGPAGSTVLELPFYFGGLLSSMEDELFAWDIAKPFTLALPQCTARCTAVSQGPVSIGFEHNGVLVGSVSWAAGQVNGVIDLPLLWEPGLLRVLPPNPADPTFAGPRITLIGER